MIIYEGLTTIASPGRITQAFRSLEDMFSNRKCRLITGSVFVLAAFFFDWVIGSDESSPFKYYFLYRVTIPNIWRAINLPPLIVAGIVAGNPHTFSALVVDIAFALQWFAIGCLVSLLFCRRSRSDPSGETGLFNRSGQD